MRRTLSVLATAIALVAASAFLAGSVAAGGGATVSATVPWTYGQIDVTEGSTYNVDAHGYVVTAKIPYYHVPGISKSASGPAGQPESPCLAAYENDLNGQCAVEEANFGALVAMVLDPDTGLAAAPPFVIGADASFVAPATGPLFLAANDLNLTYWDNNGQFVVLVTPQ